MAPERDTALRLHHPRNTRTPEYQNTGIPEHRRNTGTPRWLRRRAASGHRWRRGFEPPMQYLLEWRMALAKDLLRREPTALPACRARRLPVRERFSTAFSRATGCAPSELARAGRADQRWRGVIAAVTPGRSARANAVMTTT